MKRIVLIAAGIAVLLVAGLATVPFLIPKDIYRGQIERAARGALQRDVVLSGDVRLSLFPRIAASVSGVTVANPDGFAGANMVEAGELRGSVKWLPLFSQRVEVQEIAFVDASVALQRLPDGRTNWVLEAKPSAAAGAPSGGGFNGAVEQARLKNASLTFRDDQVGLVYTLSDLDLFASMKAIDAPLRVKADGRFQGEPFELALDLDSLAALSGQQSAAVKGALDTAYGRTTFNGNFRSGSVPQVDGRFGFDSSGLAPLNKFVALALPIDLARLGKISADGSLSGPADALTVVIDKFSQSSDLARTGFAGKISFGDSAAIDGKLTLDTQSLAALAAFARVDLPMDLAPLGGAEIVANLNGPLSDAGLSFEKLRIKGALIFANYTGSLSLGTLPFVDGRFTFETPQAGRLASQLKIDLPAATAFENVDMTAAIKGPLDKLVLSGVNLQHKGDLLNATYAGDVWLADPGRVNGQFTAGSNKLRPLLEAADVELAPGSTLQKFDSRGEISGTFSRLDVSGLTLELDDIKASGTAGIDLTGVRPRLTGRLDLGALDLSPFLGASDRKPKPAQPLAAWSKERLDLASLKSVDADLQMTTSKLTLGNVVLTDATLNSKLSDGTLMADLSRFRAFGGNWSGKFSVAANGPVPVVSFQMDGANVAISNLLGTLAGFDGLTGTGGFHVEATSRGASLHDIVNGLNGDVKSNLNEGALKGLNVTQIVRSAQSLQQAFATGNLQNLDFRGVLSPAAETEFTSFDTILKIENGVADVDLLKLLNPVLGIDGAGKIDLGGQKIDIRLATAIDKSGQGTGSVVQLNGIPVPVRISGSWDALKVTPDFTGVQAALRAELTGQVRDQLTDRVGDVAGGIIGGIIGSPPTPNDPDGPNLPTTPAPSPQQQVEDAAERAAREALGGLLGRRRTPPPAEVPAMPDQTEPDPGSDPAEPTLGDTP